MSASTEAKNPARGFTLIEVVVAIAVLAVGLVAVASLTSQMIVGTARSKYMSLAATLASEKLEDLNRWPAGDPHVAVTSGTTAGSLTSDIVSMVTVGATSESVNYYDEVLFAAAEGAVSETVSGLNASGATVYTTTNHEPDGTIATATGNSPPTPVAPLAYKRRWIIEKDTPVAGVKRVTVWVTLENQFVRPPVSFQMSMVRP
ncbi:MAG: prepilin-type N-terminal cleavage/methylation domain-containing protein [Acidobacteria bacterium]|nr:prepilin-type N-terminal cleavage/methylation domain-containing protein [Acidobacteriota bacterium]